MPLISLSNFNVLVVVVGILAAILVFSMLKGVIKMLLLAIAAISAIATWIFIQKNGFTLISLCINSPQPWMVQTLAWLATVFVFSVFFSRHELVLPAFFMASRGRLCGWHSHYYTHVRAHDLARNNRRLILRRCVTHQLLPQPCLRHFPPFPPMVLPLAQCSIIFPRDIMDSTL